jgi:O-antigen ligase
MISSSLFFLLTRGAFLAFILITAFIFFYKLIKDFKLVIVKTIISVIILFTSFQVSTIIMDSNKSNVIIDRVTSIQLNNSDESINQRLRYSSHAITSISKTPLLGIGIGNWKFISIDYDSKNMQEYIVPSFVHNDFLHIGAEIGILGLIFYVLYIFNPFILLIKKIFSSKETFFDVILLSMISVCLNDSLLNFPVARPISHIFLIFLIIVFEESLINKKKKSINA